MTKWYLCCLFKIAIIIPFCCSVLRSNSTAANPRLLLNCPGACWMQPFPQKLAAFPSAGQNSVLYRSGAYSLPSPFTRLGFQRLYRVLSITRLSIIPLKGLDPLDSCRKIHASFSIHFAKKREEFYFTNFLFCHLHHVFMFLYFANLGRLYVFLQGNCAPIKRCFFSITG